jgi:hypothetical protein
MEQGAQALATNDELAFAERAATTFETGRPRAPGTRRLGRVRIPLALAYRPWATAYRLPDGRTVWCLRTWAVDRARTRCISTARLAAYCWQSRLDALAREVERIGGR